MSGDSDPGTVSKGHTQDLFSLRISSPISDYLFMYLTSTFCWLRPFKKR